MNGLSPTTTAPDTLEGAKPRLRLLHLLPALVFLALAIVFLIRLYSGDPSKVPSALIGRPAPSFALEPLAGASQNGQPLPGLASDDLKGKLTVVNVWASWCAPCRQEHPVLMELAKDSSLRVVGINYKDTPENARRFLGAFGNPFAAVGVDPGGRAAIDWGVYGVPETFVVGPDGTIRYKHIGPILPEQMLWFRQQLRKAAHRADPGGCLTLLAARVRQQHDRPRQALGTAARRALRPARRAACHHRPRADGGLSGREP